ncbi:MAG TPA: hypothetical protein VF676_06625 [Flavobacterium sp.]|jgi:hypothetical protein
MRKISVFIAGIAALLLLSCKNEDAEKPKVIYQKPNAQSDAPKTSDIEIADLPIQIPGTDILLHPIGNYRVEGRRKASDGYEKGSFTISNFSELELTGYLQNIKFQTSDTDSIVALTDKPVLIQTATILRNAAEKSRQQVVVYTLADQDTNQDQRIDASDIRSLYLSTIEGKNFIKISADLQELIDWNLVEPKGRLYFRTIEDTNKNGEFDSNDVLHYQYVDLTTAQWKVENYNPVR